MKTPCELDVRKLKTKILTLWDSFQFEKGNDSDKMIKAYSGMIKKGEKVQALDYFIGAVSQRIGISYDKVELVCKWNGFDLNDWK